MPPNLTGYYRFVSQENMDNYLRALDINVILRKVVCLLKPDKEIIHTGDHMVIRTITSLRDYVMDFDLGVQFEEDLGPVDGRKCQTTVSWEGDQLVCEQLGEKRNRGWRHWLEGDQLHLERQIGTCQLRKCPASAPRSRCAGRALGSRGQQVPVCPQPGSLCPPSASSHRPHRFPLTAAAELRPGPRAGRAGSAHGGERMDVHVPFLLWAFLFLEVISSSPVPAKLFGEIRSPSYPNPYPNNNISIWNIHVPKGYVVKLTFRYFDLEPSESCFYDYVKIKADKKDLGRYCGRLGSTTGNHPGRKEFVSKGNRMHLEFHSDFSNEDNGTVIPYRGFLAYYQAVDLNECDPNNAAENDERPQCQHFCHNYMGGYFCSCRPGYQLQSDHHSCRVECSSELFTEAAGYLSSPEYPQPYPEDLRCNYSIRLEKGLSIILKFLEPFEIDDHQQVHCPYDQLKIQARGREIGEFCGKESPGSIETNSNEVDILFLTDESGFSRGWKIHYTSEKIRCPRPVPQDQFTIIRDLQPLYQFQDYFIVSCQTGYNLMKGNQKLLSFTAVCQADGTWHQSMPHCEIVNCGNPPALTNGAFSYVNKPADNSYQAVITYRCNEPYYHIVTGPGGENFTCSPEGTWVDGDGRVRIPTCLPVCGKPIHPVTEVQRILGGKAARRGSFPWQALTGIHGRGGGALLGDRWILTAAHTIFPKGAIGRNASLDELAEKANIFLGHTSVEELHRMGNHPVRRIFIHPDYNPKDDHNFDGDIALLELKHPVTLGPTVLPICLPDATNTTFYMDGHMGYVSGFGVEKYFISNHLKYVSLPAVAREKCQSWLDSKKSDVPMVFSENMFCAGFLTVKQDTCQGDSGSVLTALDTESGRWVATGIVSWGIGCAEGYGFYTKIINYLDWIKGIIKEDKL